MVLIGLDGLKLMNKIEEIKGKIKNSSGIRRLKLLIELCDAHINSSPSKALAIGKDALKRCHQNDYYMGKIYKLMALACYRLSKYDKSLNYAKKSLKISHKYNSQDDEFDALIIMGNNFLERCNYDKALDNYFKVLKIGERSNNEKLLTSPLNNIGLVYWRIGNHDKALHYFNKALKLKKKFNDNLGISTTLENIGSVYNDLEDYEEAIKYHKQSLEIDLEIDYKKGLATSYHNIGSDYKDMQKYEEALSYYFKSLKIREEIKHTYGIASTKKNIGKTYLKLGKYDKAISYLRKSLKMAQDLDITSKMADSFFSLYEAYKAKKDYKKALDYHLEYTRVQERIHDRKVRRKISELENRFEIEKKKKEAEIYRLKNIKLRKANAAKDKFFSIVAHDLKSPFSVFQSFINLLKNYYDKYSKEKILQLIDELENNVNSTYKLLENLLHWSRMQSGVIEYTPKSFDFYDVVDEVVKLKRNPALQKEIELKNHVPKGSIVYADLFMIETVIRNLVNNAIKFTEPGGKITIYAKNKKNDIKIAVQDTGVGMSKEQIDNLFKIETSFSTNGTRNEKGTGLGLLLCSDLIEKNKGRIKVISKIGKGSTFSFTLPRAETS